MAGLGVNYSDNVGHITTFLKDIFFISNLNGAG